MEAKRELAEIDQVMDRLPQIIPEMFDKLVPELELLTGTKAKKLPSPSELDVMIKKLRQLGAIQKQIEKLKGQEPTPEAATQMISLLNRMIRRVVPGIPRRTEPVDYVIQVVHHMSDLPTAGTLPQELDYAKSTRV